MMNILSTVSHRPYPLPPGRWRMTQRWSDLLFAHWPVPAAQIAPLLPPGLEIDTFQGQAWVGVVPFRIDQGRLRTIGERCLTVPGAAEFCELNLRTYVRSKKTGLPGVYFFCLEAASSLAVTGARILFHLPYFHAAMYCDTGANGTIDYSSRRLFTSRSVRFQAQYRGLGKVAPPTAKDPLEQFLTERYCLFTFYAARLFVCHIHHLPWPLEPAEAEISINELPAAHGFALPDTPPLLHFARELQVFIWSLRQDHKPEPKQH
jgi:hypothetical protein